MAFLGQQNVGGTQKPFVGGYVNVGGVLKKIVGGYQNVGGVLVPLVAASEKEISTLAVGSSVYMNINNVATEFIVAHHGEPSGGGYGGYCTGAWLVMKNIYELRKWDSTDNDYANSDIHAYLNGTFLNLFDSNIKSIIKQVRVPYTTGDNDGCELKTSANGLQTKVFLPSNMEILGSYTTSYNKEGANLSYFSSATVRKATYNGTAKNYFLRSRIKTSTDTTCGVNTSGARAGLGVTSSSYGIRPALILPSTTMVDGNNNIIA